MDDSSDTALQIEPGGHPNQVDAWGVGPVGGQGQHKADDRVVDNRDGSDGGAQPIRNAFTYHQQAAGHAVDDGTVTSMSSSAQIRRRTAGEALERF